MPEKTDFTPPELISVTLPSHQLIAGNKARINFEATDAGAGIQRIEFRYKHEKVERCMDILGGYIYIFIKIDREIDRSIDS